LDNWLFTKYSETKVWKRAVTLFVLMAVGVGGIGFGINEALTGVSEREQVQQERCEAGNKLRVGLVEEKQEELDEVKSHGVAYYEKFLKGSEAEIRQLRQESIEKINGRIERYAPEDCEKVVK
jgi:hypothetical protein